MTSRRVGVTAACVLAALCWAAAALRAHRTVVSPYMFHQDVAPILRQRCATCHIDGGVAPHPLLAYEEVRAQSWPIRQALISGRMPPWAAESGSAALKEQQALTPRELDVLMTWAAGGTPEGARPRVQSASVIPATSVPRPDLVIPMPEPFTLDARQDEADVEVALPSAAVQAKWIRAVDLLPGAPAIVRRATILARTASREQVIGLWLPGDMPQSLEGNAAFEVPAGATLILRVHYRRPRPGDRVAVTDRSQVAVYFADAKSARRVEEIDLGAEVRPLGRTVRAVALRPAGWPVDATINVVVVANGSRDRLLTAQLDPEWPRRYVFAAPMSIGRGSRVEIEASPSRADLWRALTGAGRVTNADKKLQATLEIVEH
jgi:hypothetical protein